VAIVVSRTPPNNHISSILQAYQRGNLHFHNIKYCKNVALPLTLPKLHFQGNRGRLKLTPAVMQSFSTMQTAINDVILKSPTPSSMRVSPKSSEGVHWVFFLRHGSPAQL